MAGETAAIDAEEKRCFQAFSLRFLASFAGLMSAFGSGMSLVGVGGSISAMTAGEGQNSGKDDLLFLLLDEACVPQALHGPGDAHAVGARQKAQVPVG